MTMRYSSLISGTGALLLTVFLMSCGSNNVTTSGVQDPNVGTAWDTSDIVALSQKTLPPPPMISNENESAESYQQIDAYIKGQSRHWTQYYGTMKGTINPTIPGPYKWWNDATVRNCAWDEDDILIRGRSIYGTLAPGETRYTKQCFFNDNFQHQLLGAGSSTDETEDPALTYTMTYRFDWGGIYQADLTQTTPTRTITYQKGQRTKYKYSMSFCLPNPLPGGFFGPPPKLPLQYIAGSDAGNPGALGIAAPSTITVSVTNTSSKPITLYARSGLSGSWNNDFTKNYAAGCYANHVYSAPDVDRPGAYTPELTWSGSNSYHLSWKVPQISVSPNPVSNNVVGQFTIAGSGFLPGIQIFTNVLDPATGSSIWFPSSVNADANGNFSLLGDAQSLSLDGVNRVEALVSAPNAVKPWLKPGSGGVVPIAESQFQVQ